MVTDSSRWFFCIALTAAVGACVPRLTGPQDTNADAEDTDSAIEIVDSGNEDTAVESGEPDPRCANTPTPTPDYTNTEFEDVNCDFTTLEDPIKWSGFILTFWPWIDSTADHIGDPDSIQGRFWGVNFNGQLDPDVVWPGEQHLQALNALSAPVYVRGYHCLEDDISTCTRYQSTSGRVFYSHGGMCSLTDPENHAIVRGFVEQVVMREIILDPDTLDTEFVEGGETWCIPRIEFVYENDVRLDW